MRQRHARAITMTIAFITALALSSSVAAATVDCRAKPDRSVKSTWRYRVIEGRSCWYHGQAIPKSGLRWAPKAGEPEPSLPPPKRRPFPVIAPPPGEPAPLEYVPVTIEDRWPDTPLMPLIVKTVRVLDVAPPPERMSRTFRTIVAYLAGALACVLLFIAVMYPAPSRLWEQFAKTAKKES